ncbi:GTP-binding protein [Sulfidibacter corallicola]|uniref:GTP-binding protein n=1 Tax=Sulfidibacter corallicola TaxID=2818388 RepID=A0A8A4TQD6_SULCO|nr:GTP-binding protein [Sulfidibacter corallicola]QTD52179.1 GTP-binding protein [Sulfidibacter corallicola]
MKQVPVTVLSGFLGSGKTTFLNYLLHADHGRRIGVLVNDFGSVNIDADLVTRIEGETMSLANGCICCSIRGDMEETLVSMVDGDEKPDHLLIEASGVSDPAAIVQTFALSHDLRAKVYLDGIVAVVDGEQVRDLKGKNALLARRQIAVADLLLVNKVDLLDDAQRASLSKWLRQQVSDVRLVETVRGRVPLELVFGLGGKKWREAAEKDTLDVHVHDVEQSAKHAHENHLLEFETWTYRGEKPFDFTALKRMMSGLPASVYRVKGIVQLQNMPAERTVLQVAGRRVSFLGDRLWRDTRPYTELVFIAAAGKLDPDRLAARMDQCLADAKETAAEDRQADAIGKEVQINRWAQKFWEHSARAMQQRMAEDHSNGEQ